MAPPFSDRHVALLRGINVGGKNKVPMKDLVAMFEAAGCTDVRHYIQSGNVVFTASAPTAERVPAAVTRVLQKQLGVTAPVLLRSAAELARAARSNPFLAEGAAPETVHLAFLADAPAPAAVRALDPQRSPGDRFAVRGRDVYLHLPHGVARTKLTNAWLDAQLKTVSTVRNWRTVEALLVMLGE